MTFRPIDAWYIITRVFVDIPPLLNLLCTRDSLGQNHTSWHALISPLFITHRRTLYGLNFPKRRRHAVSKFQLRQEKIHRRISFDDCFGKFRPRLIYTNERLNLRLHYSI